MRSLFTSILLLPLAALAAPKVAEELTVLGFSDDGGHFSVVITAADAPTGKLWRWDLATGKATADQANIPVPADRHPVVPKALKTQLGDDAGQERYRSGTATATTVEVSGAPMEVRLLPVDGQPGRAQLRLKRGSCERTLPLDGEGTDANLSSVLASRSGEAIAVISKYTVDGARRYRIAVARAEGELETPRCRGEARRAARPALDAACIAALMKLAGKWTGATKDTDFEGGGEVVAHTITIDRQEARPHFLLWIEPGVGPAIDGPIVTCTKSKTGDALNVEVEAQTEEHEVAAVELVPKAGTLVASWADQSSGGPLRDSFEPALKR